MIKYFRCSDCGFQFAAPTSLQRPAMYCGAVVGYLPKEDDPDNHTPLGCGGSIMEVSEEEAMSEYERKR